MSYDEYTPRDPTLASWDHGVAELRVNGELRAYLVCVVSRIGLRDPGQPWPWFVVVWPDGQKDPAQEDYGSGWLTVRELDGGTFTYNSEPYVVRESKFPHFFPCTELVGGGVQITYDVTWFDPDKAAETWARLDLKDSDF